MIVIFIVYFSEIKAYVLSKLPKRKSKQKQEKPKETQSKKAPTFTVEDFVPTSHQSEDEMARDESLASLFDDEEFIEMIDEQFEENSRSPQIPKFNFDNEFADFNKFIRKDNNKNQTIAQKINQLPPEIKAMLIDGILKKRDDI